MPSAYLLAKDHVEQARAVLANEVWFDAEIDQLFDVALARLSALDARVFEGPVRPPRGAHMRRSARLMPWLDP